MDLERGDTDAFRRSLTSFLASIPYDSHGSLKDIDITEKHFQYTFYLLLRLIGVYCTAIHCEDRQSYGRWIVRWRWRITSISLNSNGWNSTGSSGTNREDWLRQALFGRQTKSDLHRSELLICHTDSRRLGRSFYRMRNIIIIFQDIFVVHSLL